MLDNHTTEIFSRTLRRTENYLTIEGAYKKPHDFSVLLALIVVIGMVSVAIWRYL